MQMQMVPTGSSRPPDALLAGGGGATATPNVPARSEPTLVQNFASAEFRDEREIPPTEVRVEPVINYTPPAVIVDLSPIAAALDALGKAITEQPHVVNVAPPTVNVAAPIVRLPAARPVIKRVERDPRTGNILRVVEEPVA
jgi:hypothetical protein